MRMRVDSVGWAVPERVESSAELSAKVGRSLRWIVDRTGVENRRVADEPMEVLGARAAREALGQGPPPDLILNASLTPRQLIPDSSVFLQRELGYSGIPSFSIHATCLSFLVALHVAGALVCSSHYRRILVVSTETGTISRNFAEQESAVLIGDGAAAAVVVASEAGAPSELLAYKMRTYPEGAELTEFRGAGTFRHPNDPRTTREDNLFSMHGPGVYRMGRRRVAEILDELFAEAGVRREDVACVVPHQASGPAVASLQNYGFPPDKVVNIVKDYGNCIAASIPMALATAVREERLRRGDLVLLLGTGAGLGVAGALLRW